MSGLKAKIRALAAAAAVVLGAGLAAIVIPLAALLPMAVLGVEPSPALVIGLSVVLTQGVAFGGVALLYLAIVRGRVRVPLRWPTVKDLQWMVGGSALALAALIVGGLAVTLLGVEVGTHQVQEIGMTDPEIFALLIPLSFLLIGPGEELLFRGVVQGRLRQAFGPVSAVTIAAVVFAAVHVAALTGPTHARLAGVAVLLLPSLVFGLSYERTRNIAVPAVIHGTYNATLLALSYYAAGFEGAAGT
jgi:uncharacterized protein